MASDLFSRVVALTGLSPLLGPGTVRRALTSVGVDDPQKATVGQYRKALPQLRRRLKVYLLPDEAEARSADIESLLDELPDGP